MVASTTARNIKPTHRRLQRHHDQIHTDDTCYNYENHQIKASFSASDAIMASWVGIYSADQVELNREEVKDVYKQPLYSIWACEKCENPNQVTFEMEIDAGSYVVQSHGIGHYGQTTFAQSKPFEIKPVGEHCNDTHLKKETNLRASASKM